MGFNEEFWPIGWIQISFIWYFLDHKSPNSILIDEKYWITSLLDISLVKFFKFRNPLSSHGHWKYQNTNYWLDMITIKNNLEFASNYFHIQSWNIKTLTKALRSEILTSNEIQKLLFLCRWILIMIQLIYSCHSFIWTNLYHASLETYHSISWFKWNYSDIFFISWVFMKYSEGIEIRFN
jgi:hypothetical protein